MGHKNNGGHLNPTPVIIWFETESSIYLNQHERQPYGELEFKRADLQLMLAWPLLGKWLTFHHKSKSAFQYLQRLHSTQKAKTKLLIIIQIICSLENTKGTNK